VVGAGLLINLLAHRHLPPIASAIPQPLAPALALLVDLPPYTRFPLFPLVGFTAIGVVTGQALAARQPTPRQSLLLGGLFAALAVLFTYATIATVQALGGSLSRAHPAVVLNLLNGACRALAVLFLSLALADSLSGNRTHPWLAPLVRLGRGSLLAYAFHIGLCYGRLAAPLAHRLDMAQATMACLALMVLTYLVVYGRDQARLLWQRIRR
jgi:uncharacterized membrane protein